MDKAEELFKKKKKVAEKLLEYGLPIDAASGVLGNIAIESKFDPSIVEKQSTGTNLDKSGKPLLGKGLFQHTGSRRDALVKFASDNNLDPNDAETQIIFMKKELNESPFLGKKQLLNSRSPEEAASVFMKKFEKPDAAMTHESRRRAEAIKAKDQLYIEELDAAQKRGEQLPMAAPKKKWLNTPEKPIMQQIKEITASIKPTNDPARLLASTDDTMAVDLANAQEAQLNKAEELTQQAEQIAPVAAQINESAETLKKKIPVGQETQDNSKSNGISPELKDALMFMAPQAIGMVLGGIMEGSQGAIAGAEQAGKLRDAYNDFRFKKAEMEIKQSKSSAPATKQNFQLMPEFTDQEGNPVQYNKVSGEILNMKGQVVEPGTLVNLKEQRAGRYANIQEQNLGIKKSQVGQLSDKQVEIVSANDAVDRSIQEMESAFDPSVLGKIDAPIEEAKTLYGGASDNYVRLKSATSGALSAYVKMLSGAQVSEAEAQRLGQVVPNVNDDETTFRQKQQAFRNIIQNYRSALLNAVKSGQPLKTDIVTKMLSETQSAVSAIKQRKVTPDNKRYIMPDEDRKRLEELRNKYRR